MTKFHGPVTFWRLPKGTDVNTVEHLDRIHAVCTVDGVVGLVAGVVLDADVAWGEDGDDD